MNLIDILTLLASAHGFFLGTLILHKYRHLVANRFLASMLFLLALILLEMSLMTSGLFSSRPYLLMFIIGGAFLIGPLHFLYAKHLTRPDSILVPRDLLHGIPFLLYQIWLVIISRLAPEGIRVGLDPNHQDAWMQDFGLFHPIILTLYSVYLIKTLLILREHQRRVQSVFSSLEKVRLTWLRNITWLALGTIVVYAAEFSLLITGTTSGQYFTVTSVIWALNIYIMGYLGLFNSEVLGDGFLQRTLSAAPNPEAVEQATPTPTYQKSGLTGEDLENYKVRLLDHMENVAPQSDSGLTLDQLAGQVGLSPHNLSEVINRGIGQNFFDFVNGYRVQAVQKRLVDPEMAHLTVLALAMESGFASKSTFNAIFKKHTGLTPSAYRKQHS